MKIEIEIKDNDLVYSYKVGHSEHTSKKSLSTEGLLLFNEMLRYLFKDTISNNDDNAKIMSAYWYNSS